ncbi:MAG: PepSY-like domain-containing protein [Paramuribaculum sp.]|nr:PepSY-like domain-containing protein [Paramuribaculum sp.]
MKRLFKFIPVLFAGVIALTLMSCSDDDKDINPTDLPSNAKAFIATYYPSAKIVKTTKDKNEYDVILNNGHTIDFNKDGEWIDVDAPVGQTVPTGFYPASIDTYISSNFGTSGGINEISVNARGFEVDLVSGVELIFDQTGTFVGLDN